ncbi:FBP domain-containing protein [Microbacterium sp. SORGH_AS_0888]|uniref:FBP domain-containing protein n=1 Tax=Microbacterium sp. SORGH_AS_0888 TaxID=3041791 RepID=UPI00278B69DA|nr:FBP domain-containing protein [Microbacterium sp. SORGH_AS_0888]MDQ1130683.1 hypothetical protein [Microbacterium sp. SORGH_AS_0888]
MRPLTEQQIRDCLVGLDDDDRRQIGLPHDFLLLDWDHLDFLAWRDPRMRGRGYLIVELDGRAVGVALRAADASGRARSAMCNVCHTMQPGNQVSLFTAQRPDASGSGIGTYMCADLSCHENVRLAAPLAPGEIRASVDRRIDGTRSRAERFVARVTTTEGDQ